MRNDHAAKLYKLFSLKATEHLIDNDFKGRITPYLAVGADLRLHNLSTTQRPRANAFTVREGNLYVAIDPMKHLTLYIDTDLANLVNREAVGLIHDLPAGLWVKFGRLNLPYGLRLADDSAFIRNDLGFSFAAQDIGIELGLEPGPFTLAAGFTNGVGGGATDDNNAKAVSWFSEWRSRLFRLGGSFHYNNAATVRMVTGGGHLGFHVGPFALLGEFDLQRVRNKVAGTDRTVYASYAEANYRLIQGLTLRGIYDGIDDQLAGAGLHHRISVGMELFPIPFLETNLLYRMRIGSGNLDDDQVLLVLHGFF